METFFFRFKLKASTAWSLSYRLHYLHDIMFIFVYNILNKWKAEFSFVDELH